MNFMSRTITGIVLIFIGISLSFISLVYGIPVLIIGIIILFNKKEDEIEKIKYGKFERTERRKK